MSELRYNVLTRLTSSNNYNEFRRKSELELDASDYWKYIDGPDYKPPVIPALETSMEVDVFVEGNWVKGKTRGNEAAVALAKAAAKTWLDGNKKALAVIVKAVPTQKLYVVDNCKSAHSAWFALKNEYEPTNSLAAISLKQQIIGNVCRDSDDPASWLTTMIQLYSRLRDADPLLMPDSEFAKHLATLMTSDADWRYCRDHLHENMKEAEAAGTPYSSRQVIQRLREEEIHKGISASTISVNAILSGKRGKQTDNPLPGAYSANSSSSSSRQTRRIDRKPKPYPGANEKKKICGNEFCGYPVGHTIEECFAYNGGSADTRAADRRKEMFEEGWRKCENG